MIRADKFKHEGHWKNGVMHGQGKESWPDGTEFFGNYKEGVKCGYGEFHWPNGEYYEG
jgi:MORN repeat